MEERTAAAVLIVGPADEPTKCISHETRNGAKLPKTTVDITRNSLKDSAKKLVQDCPAVPDWEFTSHTEEYSYRYGGATPVKKTVHVFLVVATDRNKNTDSYSWVSLSDIRREFDYGGAVIETMRKDINRFGLTELGFDDTGQEAGWERTPTERAENVEQKTTLDDF